jgi:hypothetical protein
VRVSSHERWFNWLRCQRKCIVGHEHPLSGKQLRRRPPTAAHGSCARGSTGQVFRHERELLPAGSTLHSLSDDAQSAEAKRLLREV